VIVGAGIAGLSLAHALARGGVEVELLEREPGPATEGAGLTLWPNAVRALRELGLGEALESVAHPVREALTVTPRGETLMRVPLERLEPRFGPLVAVHRAELLAALTDGLEVPIRYGARVKVESGTLRNGGTEVQADLIVGADGIGSSVRERVAPGVAPRPAGYVAWRGVARTGEQTPSAATEAMGEGRRFGLVPLSGGRTYWFAVLPNTGGGSARLAGREELAAQFANWHDPIGAVLAAPQQGRPSCLEIADLPPLPRWRYGNAVLVGDAAHATTPNLGQGAALALGDVATLAPLLLSLPLREALGAYEQARKRHAEAIVRQSRAVGRSAQLSNPLACRLRNAVMRAIPPRLVERRFSAILSA
jgi:2-polyprenyl-6-methoxyphenol hydroxylase-like FAD-dependent oxidoreductase